MNADLREIGGDDFTAKDFRTWAGPGLAALALAEVRQFKTTRAAEGVVLGLLQQRLARPARAARAA